jgi:hypothetical protein
MRLTLVLLSNLRALLVTRAVYLAFLVAVLCAASTPRATASQVRAHHRPAAHRSATSARTRIARSSTSSTATHVRSYSSARRRTTRRQPTVVRARMPIRRYSWMTARRSAASVRYRRTSVAEAAGTPSPITREAQRAGVITPQTSVAEAEVSDASETNSPTPQDAANQIAADEIPVPHAALAAPIAGLDPLHSTRIVAMAPLRGSLESLIRQNEKTNADNLERIENDADLHERIARGQLVRVPESDALAVNANLPVDRRYCRPWTATFLTDLSRAHQAQFHHPFEVSSAVRTVEYQKHLMRTNGNAAPAVGDIASPHLTGATIDIAKSGLGRSEIYWMRDRLNSLQSEGKIDVEEEFRQSCFHITVYKSYIGAGPLHKGHHPIAAPPSEEESPSAPAEAAATPGF